MEHFSIKLQDCKNKDDKRSHAKEIKQALEELPPKIDVIKYYQVGINITDSPKAYDIVLVSDFESIETPDAYRIHPAHVAVVKLIRKYSESTKAVDFVTD